METIVIQTANEQELELISAFLKEHHLKSYFLNEENKEDLALGRLMDKTDYNNTVDTDSFLKKLH